jgi:hypothetical protein
MKGVTRYDDYLTNLSLAYPRGNLVGEIVAPIVPVDFFSDKVFVDADDAIMQVNDSAEGVQSHGVDFEVGSPYSYRTTRKALHDILRDKEVKNANQVIKMEQRITNKLTWRLLLKHEMRVASILTDAAKVTQKLNLAGTGHKQINETGGSDEFETALINAVKTIYNNTGATANTIVIPFEAALHVANLSFVKDTLKYQYGMEVVSAEFQRQAMALVGLPPVIKGLKVVVSNGRAASYNKGTTASVTNPFGNNILIGYVPQNPQAEDVFGVLTMEYEGRRVSKERVTDPAGTKLLVEWDYDVLEAELKCWYLLQNVIAA